jgi:hypothetical protein
MLALAWWNLLRQFGTSVSIRWAIKTYGISQLAKYVPGNIFHLAGRQAMGMAAGVPGWVLAKSSILELVLISFAGSMFSLLALPLLIPGLSVAISTGVFVVVAVIAVSLLRSLVGLPVAHVFALHLGFLAISGLLFTDLVTQQDRMLEISSFTWLPLCGAYVLAWLIGLVTPGAPAGVGVRELVLLFLLKGEISEIDLVFAVLLGRIMTVGGDVFIYVISMLMSSDNGQRITHD